MAPSGNSRGREQESAPAAEENLRESQRRYQALIETNVDFIWEMDAEGRYTYCSPQMEKLWGIAPGAMVGKTPFDIMPPEAREPARREFWALARNPVPFSGLESAAYDGQGRPIFIETSGVPFFDDHGQLLGYRGVTRDVTAHKRALADLKRQEDFAAFALATAGMGAWDLDLDDHSARRSLEHDRIFGYQEALPEWTYETFLEHVLPEDRAAVDEKFRRAVAGKRDWSFECRIRRRDGQVRWIWAAGRPRIEGDGRGRRMAGIVQDITVRRAAEQRMATLARLYETLSRANESIVRTQDEQSLFEQICRIVAEVGGFPLVWIGLLRERAVVPVARAGAASAYLDEIRVTLDGDLGHGPTGTSIREDRAVVNDDFASNPLTEPWRAAATKHGFGASAAFPLRHRGRPVGALTLYAAQAGAFDAEHVRLLEALCADVAFALDALSHEHHRVQAERALRDSEQSLKESDARKNQFLATLSHELRNPLMPVKSSLYVLAHTAPGSDAAVRAQAVIERQVNQLARLVDDLLDVTRIARGKIQLQRAEVELVALVQRTAEDHRTLLEAAGLTLELDTPAHAIVLEADPNRVAQVLGNLLHNAAKFTPAGGRVELSVELDPVAGEAVIEVADTGTGMSAEMLAHVFEPFVQADATLARSQGGLGLGLALAKGLVEQHGGSITASSHGPGCGSEFTVRLPVGAGRAEHPHRDGAPSRPAHCRVLVIDDNVDAADSLRQVLEIQGHTVAVAYNGLDGIAKARELIPDLVLCDIGLPLMDGYEIARRLRADVKLQGARLIALTGYALPSDVERATAAGFEQHVAKPLRLDKLIELLNGSANRK